MPGTISLKLLSTSNTLDNLKTFYRENVEYNTGYALSEKLRNRVVANSPNQIDKFINILILGEGFNDQEVPSLAYYSNFEFACYNIIHKMEHFISPFAELKNYINYFTVEKQHILSEESLVLNKNSPIGKFGLIIKDDLTISYNHSEIRKFIEKCSFEFEDQNHKYIINNGSVWLEDESKSKSLVLIITPNLTYNNIMLRGQVEEEEFGIVNCVSPYMTKSEVINWYPGLYEDLRQNAETFNTMLNELISKVDVYDSLQYPSLYFCHELGHLLGLSDEYEEFQVNSNPMLTLNAGLNVDIFSPIDFENHFSTRWESYLTRKEKSEGIKKYPNFSNMVVDQSSWYFTDAKKNKLSVERISNFVYSNVEVEKFFDNRLHQLIHANLANYDQTVFMEGASRFSSGIGRPSADCLMRRSVIILELGEMEIPQFCKVCKKVIEEEILKINS